MFLCCEQSNNTLVDETLDLHEPAQALSTLLQFLHHLPEPPVESEGSTPSLEEKHAGTTGFIRERFLPRIPSYNRSTVIPLPVLQPMLFDLVDKYGLSIDIFNVLCAHLLAHAPTYPLRVYGFAASFEPRHRRRRFQPGSSGDTEDRDLADGFGAEAEKEMERQMQKIASKASQFLEPMGSYPIQEVLDAIPSVKALHRVVQLQHLRVKTLREVLNESEIFPKGYGACPSHREKTMECWDRQRKALAGKIDSGTDVAGEMELFVDTLKECKICHKAGVAAVEMLAYMCYRLPKQVQHSAGLA
ncbi:hypothetical protein P691DRAFT_804257 [Macrolepiota fuliginosa MF-IS2]|uniref:Uncharacterized protein n=1 Tax=Macrolepiota fuliginosa MF-IS2 TaxID=1400762 RepID=A0A9P5XKP4_9AGAR|nr:hypothetical protein P691DRAFT_804257 [Macrolepiota fuliginosa MF-IS2]